jgi:Ni/Co efflux regulator RcnB
MRKTLSALLLATAFAPAAAYAQDLGHDRGSRVGAERSEPSGQSDSDSDVHQPRRDRALQRSERPSRPERTERPERIDRADRVEGKADRTPRLDESGDLDRAMRSDRMQDPDRPVRAGRPGRTGQTDSDPQPAPQGEAPVPAQPVQQSGRKSDSLLDGFRQGARDSASGRDNDRDDHHDRDWSHDWRKDKRFDWWHYRSRYGSLYRLGHYRDPYGWGYRRWTMGYTLWPSYYGSSFWLNDPWMYRLPPAYGPYRWVRYYDDALLVNIYTGHVVDVVYNFFW